MNTETTLTADAPAVASTPAAGTAGSWAEIGDILRRHVEAAGEVIAPVVISEDDNPDLWDEEPTNPQRLARLYRDSVSPSLDGPLRLRHWCGDFYDWKDGRYRLIDVEVMRNLLRTFVAEEFHRVYTLRMTVYKLKADQKPKRPKVDPVRDPLIRDVMGFLASLCMRETAGVATLPSWIGERADERPPAEEILAFPNGLLHAPTGQWVDATPEFFGLTTLAFGYDPTAPAPAEWLKFLQSVWPSDQASIDALQEWMGYLLTSDNRYQKGLWIVGMTRGGKGVMMDTVRGLVGDAAVACPTLRQLGEPYGLAVLVDSAIASIDEPRVCHRTDNVPGIVNTIKRITGGSPVDIARKHQTTLKGVRLATRFVLTSNDLLPLDDASGVVANRFVVLTVPTSHAGKEDTGLSARIRAELPGILLWALAGLRRLHARGRFTQPETGGDELRQLHDMASPISQFAESMLVIDPDADVFAPTGLIYPTWKEWCATNGEPHGSANSFSAKLNSILPAACKSRQGRILGQVMRYFPGVRLRGPHDRDDPAPSCTDGGSGDRYRDRYIPETVEQSGIHCSNATVNEKTQESVPIPPVYRSPYRSDGGDRYTANACERGVYNPLYRCTDDTSEIDYCGDSIENQSPEAPKCDEEAHTVQIQPAMGGDRYIGTDRDTGSTFDPPSAGSQHLRHDLYIDNDLNIQEYPVGTAAPVVQVGPTIYHRVTPAVVAELLIVRERTPPGPDLNALDGVLGTLTAHVQLVSPDELDAAVKAAGL